MILQWEFNNGIGLMTIDQPPSNTMTLGFFHELKELMGRISVIQGLRALIITGRGRHFSSGADISELLENISESTLLGHYQTCLSIERMNIPVISSIRGVCLGSAFELALFSHFRICTPDAVLGLPETTFGLIPGLGGIQRIAALAGKAKAIEIILRGITFPASDAMEMGLVDAMVPKEQMIPAVLAFIEKIDGRFRNADRQLLVKRLLNPTHPIENER